MSYEIMYDKQCIDLGNGKYIPLFLMGSNNCTMFYGGREILERSWTSLFGKIIVTKEEFINTVKSSTENRSYDSEWFKVGGKWVTDSSAVKWFENVFKKPHTMEEYAENYNSLHCYTSLSYSDENDSTRWETKNSEFIRTTKGLIEWIEKYGEYREDGKTSYPVLTFGTIKPITIANKNVSGDFIVRIVGRKEYLLSAENRGYTLVHNKEEAKVFSSIEEFEEMVKNSCFKSFGTRYTFEKPSKALSKAMYAIVIKDSNKFIKRKSSAHIFFTYNVADAIKFPTEKKTLDYISKINCSSINGKMEVFTV